MPTVQSPTIAEIHAKVAKRRRVKLTFNEDEIRLLYVLAVREATDRPCLAGADSLAGTHDEHQEASSTALAKLSDAILDLEGDDR